MDVDMQTEWNIPTSNRLDGCLGEVQEFDLIQFPTSSSPPSLTITTKQEQSHEKTTIPKFSMNTWKKLPPINLAGLAKMSPSLLGISTSKLETGILILCQSCQSCQLLASSSLHLHSSKGL
ncbi:hypothetical protein PAAG_00541 [Paracoccidioides lutzii Pb01]|uniref:Uncharacterized protein n=1 Tax=Paracoccidioides lutzii (strain ATCC MYA-826 / Pb01) TaxID=502779 RepID=C1GPU6_PARBA|nr:hypothetical protein PAAG_00541 [Paracoccidioides lutzii Pb01]EEH36218.2 hypothetical protein PAAG_00541 [Paracoccidioides lutzii Pb01]